MLRKQRGAADVAHQPTADMHKSSMPTISELLDSSQALQAVYSIGFFNV